MKAVINLDEDRRIVLEDVYPAIVDGIQIFVSQTRNSVPSLNNNESTDTLGCRIVEGDSLEMLGSVGWCRVVLVTLALDDHNELTVSQWLPKALLIELVNTES
jgi:hypothetical protein